MTEIERKFLVADTTCIQQAQKKYHIVQGYLNRDSKRTVRVRIQDSRGFLTIKGQSSDDGWSRYEWEKEISVSEATELLELCEPYPIAKIRHIITFKNQEFEVDEFLEENQGLWLAELELESINQSIQLPDWIGKEVTGDRRYYNSYLSQKPFSTW